MSEKKPTIASLQRKIERLEVQLEAAKALNHRIGASDFSTVLQNADMRMRLAQVVELAGCKS